MLLDGIEAAVAPRIAAQEPPTGQHDAAQAIEQFGILRGLVLGAWRLLRCNPFSHGGLDPIEAQRLFRRRTPASHL